MQKLLVGLIFLFSSSTLLAGSGEGYDDECTAILARGTYGAPLLRGATTNASSLSSSHYGEQIVCVEKVGEIMMGDVAESSNTWKVSCRIPFVYKYKARIPVAHESVSVSRQNSSSSVKSKSRSKYSANGETHSYKGSARNTQTSFASEKSSTAYKTETGDASFEAKAEITVTNLAQVDWASLVFVPHACCKLKRNIEEVYPTCKK